VNSLLSGISATMRKDSSLRKRWASCVMQRIVSALRLAGLSVRDTFYAYARGDTMMLTDFRRFVENQGLRLTREEIDDLIRAIKLGDRSGRAGERASALVRARSAPPRPSPSEVTALRWLLPPRQTYFDFREIFAAAEKTHEGWGRLGVHLKTKLAAHREFIESTMRAADTGGSGTLNRAQIRRVVSSHVLTLSPSEIEQAVKACPSLNDGGSAGRIDYSELLRGLVAAPPPHMSAAGHAGRAAAQGMINMVDGPITQPVGASVATGGMPQAGAGSQGLPGTLLGNGFASGGGLGGAVPPERQMAWMSEVESTLYHGSNKLSWLSQSMQDDLGAGEAQWGGPTSVQTPAFQAWLVQMKTQLTQFVTHYDKVVQQVHERLGVFTTPTSVVERLGLNQRDIPGAARPKPHRYSRRTSGSMPRKPAGWERHDGMASQAAWDSRKSGPRGRAEAEYVAGASATAQLRVEELELQLNDVRQHVRHFLALCSPPPPCLSSASPNTH
jgi:hypothetical protein